MLNTEIPSATQISIHSRDREAVYVSGHLSQNQQVIGHSFEKLNLAEKSFEIKNKIETQWLSSLKSIGILTAQICISGPNLVILARTGEKLSCGQVQNWINFDFKLNVTLMVKADQLQKQ